MIVPVSPRRRRAGVAFAVAVLSVLGLFTAAVPSSSAAGQHLRAGRGYRGANGDFVGYYVTANGTKVYCLSPRKALPTGVTMRELARYPGLSRTRSQELAYALHEWGDAGSARGGAIESQVLNTIAGNGADVSRRARNLPASIRTIVRQHLTAARRLHGPYTVAVRTPKALLPGQLAIGTVVITSAAGHRLTGSPVLMTASANTVVTRRVRTDAHGVGRFAYRVTDVGEVHVHALATDLPPTRVRVNHPSASQQRMVSWSGRAHARASAAFRRAPSGFSHSYACTTACAGRPATTLHACAPAGAVASRLGFRHQGEIAYLTFPASHAQVCKSLVLTLADGVEVEAAWQYRTAHGWSRAVAATGTFIVDCPAVPAVGVTMSYDCTAASVTIALAERTGTAWIPLVNATQRRMVLVVGDRRIYADPGQRAIYTASVSCASRQTFRVQAGVRRAAGQFNYGATASVTTPGG